MRFPVYPVVQHLAEKLHAYTLPRAHENTRVKDLVDMICIATIETIGGGHLAGAVAMTFAARGTHGLPEGLTEPPESWRVPFRRLAGEAAASPTTELEEAHALAVRLWEPVLKASADGLRWRPRFRRWEANTDTF